MAKRVTETPEQDDLFDDDYDVEEETGEEAFIRLINKRLPVAVKRLRLVANLSASRYTYTDDQAEKVIGILRVELDKLEKAFRNEKLDDDVPQIL